MNKIRDIIYNKSDILVTLFILVIAGLLIAWRVSAIMNYGSDDNYSSDGIDSGAGIVSSSMQDDSSEPQDTGDADAAGTDGDAAASPDGEADADASSEGTDAVQQQTTVSIVVEQNDTADAIAVKLVTAGLITDKQQFLTAVSAASAETRLKMGTFNITSGMTPEQMVAVFTS